MLQAEGGAGDAVGEGRRGRRRGRGKPEAEAAERVRDDSRAPWIISLTGVRPVPVRITYGSTTGTSAGGATAAASSLCR